MTSLSGFDLCRAALAVDGISAPEQSVLTVLAIMADDDGRCWPPIGGPRGLTSKTKLSERAVQNAIKALAKLGHITREERVGKGVTYTVHLAPPAPPAPRTTCTPQEMRPAGDAATPAPPAPKQPRTTIPQKASPSSKASASRARPLEMFLPADFHPQPKPGSITAKAMDDWPPGELEEQLEHFADYHTANRTKSADWQASWRTWVKNWKSFNGRRTSTLRSNRGSSSRPADGFTNALREASGFGAADQR